MNLHVCIERIKPGSHLFVCVATGSAYEIIWTCVRDTGIEKSSIPTSVSQRASKSFHIHFQSQRNQAKRCEPGFRLHEQVQKYDLLMIE